MLVIEPRDEAALKEAVQSARANPIPWSTLQFGIPKKQGPVLTLQDRNGLPDVSRPRSQEVVLPSGHRVCISCEEQPAGLCLHLSMSSPDPFRQVPIPQALEMVLESCGITEPADRAWVEEFSVDGKPGGRAVNVLVLLEPQIVRVP